ncbi:MAG: hypothetical protein U9R02_08610 [Thermodesulfobacteriota bacterium]|nr:hypothetical protein [Thermodesulfobacteriota bacterium]
MKKLMLVNFLLLWAFNLHAHSFGPDLDFPVNTYFANELPSSFELSYETVTGKQFPSYSDDDKVLWLRYENAEYLVFLSEINTWDENGIPNSFLHVINFIYDVNNHAVLEASQAPEVADRAMVHIRAIESSVRINVTQEYIDDEMTLVSGNPIAKAVLLANNGYNAVNEWVEVAYNQATEDINNVVSIGREWIWSEIIYGPITSEVLAAGFSESDIRNFIQYDELYDALVGEQEDLFIQYIDSAYDELGFGKE